MDQHINIKDYSYDLPAERIALHPLLNRDQSKLLVYNAGEINHVLFASLADHLPKNALLFFNDTKVIPARLFFQKQSGSTIELFLLNPIVPSLLQLAMETRGYVSWKCTIGNLKRWQDDSVLTRNLGNIEIQARLENREHGIVNFSWTPLKSSFAEVVNTFGVTPLPPYIKRDAEQSDRERYQTVYSQYDGAVAAPTAGLHFTKKVFEDIERKGIETDFLTLHVSAGTFQPVKVKNAVEHEMHSEQVIVNRKNIENLLSDKTIIAVGTTSARTLESLYWYGVKLIQDSKADFTINQIEPYQLPSHHSKKAAFAAVAKKMAMENMETIAGKTSIYILPGYSFKVCEALITNFHQPGSTLMLLVAALIGDDWKKIYSQAIKGDYRFLSYGDSSLLIPGFKGKVQ
ncbi:MAG: S-adenosylmethionine:tRNA ribosyltransferase-isomerase [Bacteroidia bacterium]|nr:S-adenosylmethionine:tRNA ribosyltransferase-isomerase [Bacteroidia bacterium]